jgi:hypothetical protein
MPLPNILLAEFLEAGKAAREVTPAEAELELRMLVPTIELPEILEAGRAASELTTAEVELRMEEQRLRIIGLR